MTLGLQPIRKSQDLEMRPSFACFQVRCQLQRKEKPHFLVGEHI